MAVNSDFRFIDNASGLAEVVEDGLTSEAVAIDTEFQRVRTYYPKPALYQVRVDDRCYLVDPVAIEDMMPLCALLQASDVKKVLHGCQEDLTLFESHLGIQPEALFDTQVAAAFAGFRYPIGYQGLVLQLLDVSLSKAERRSNWLQRPLSEAQKSYAAEDVRHLLPLYEQLMQRLHKLGRLHWFEDEMRRLYFSKSQNRYPYRQYAYAWKLQKSTLLRFQKLWQWREQMAQSRDRPRQFIVKDKLLYELAKQPKPDRALEEDPKIGKRYGAEIRRLICKADATPNDLWPSPIARPLDVSENELLRQLQMQVQQLSEQLSLPESLLATKKMLTSLITAVRDQVPPPAWLSGWRNEIIDKSFMDQII